MDKGEQQDRKSSYDATSRKPKRFSLKRCASSVLSRINAKDTFDTQLRLLAANCEECCHEEDRWYEAYKIILKIKTLCLQSGLRDDDVRQIAEFCFYDQNILYALLFFVCETKILTGYYWDTSDAESAAVKRIQMSVWHLNNVVICLKSTHKELCRRVVIPVMKDAAVKILSFRKTGRDKRILTAAWCFKHIGVCYDELTEFSKFQIVTLEGIQLLQKLSDDKTNYHIYGALLNNLATAQDRIGNTDKAIKTYQRSIASKIDAVDWPNDETKFASIQLTVTNLKIIQE